MAWAELVDNCKVAHSLMVSRQLIYSKEVWMACSINIKWVTMVHQPRCQEWIPVSEWPPYLLASKVPSKIMVKSWRPTNDDSSKRNRLRVVQSQIMAEPWALKTVWRVLNKFIRNRRGLQVARGGPWWPSVVRRCKPTECLSHWIRSSFKNKLSNGRPRKRQRWKSSKNWRLRWRIIRRIKGLGRLGRGHLLRRAAPLLWPKTHHMQIYKFSSQSANRSPRHRWKQVQKQMSCGKTPTWEWTPRSNRTVRTPILMIGSLTMRMDWGKGTQIMTPLPSPLCWGETHSIWRRRRGREARNPRATRYLRLNSSFSLSRKTNAWRYSGIVQR